MKDSARTVLGYLAAFTLGIICMAVILIATRSPAVPERRGEPGAKQPEDVVIRSPRPERFQRLRPRGVLDESVAVEAAGNELRAPEPAKEEKPREVSPAPEPAV